MHNEKVTFHQAIYSIALYCFGSSVIMGVSTDAKQDSWIAILLAALFISPVFLAYARIMRLFPEKNLFEIMEILFGKVVGGIFTALLTWYAIHLAALVLRDFAEFIQVLDLPETPQLPIMILIALTTVYLAQGGMKAIGKWSVVAICFVSFVVALTFSMPIRQMNFKNLLPVMECCPAFLAKNSLPLVAFPYGESVIFLCLADSFRKQDSPYKLYFASLLLIVIFFLLVFVRNLALLGLTMMEASYFPSYLAVRIVEVGDFFARIESSISSNFILAGILKQSACLLAASKGIVRLFRLPCEQTFVLPAGMLALALCAILYQSTMEMMAFLEYYFYYSLPFQVIIPLIVWVAAEIHTRRQKKQDAPPMLGEASPL